jgi:hypothetical protein
MPANVRLRRVPRPDGACGAGALVVQHGGDSRSSRAAGRPGRQADRTQVLEHLLVEAGPQFVGHAGLRLALAIALAAALGGIERLIDGMDDVGHRHHLQRLGQAIAAAGAAHAGNQLAATQLAEQLLQIGKGNLLPLADTGQSHRTGMLAQGKIDHRGYRKTSFGRQSHLNSPSGVIQSGNRIGINT